MKTALHIVRRLTDAEDTTNICLTVVLRSGEHEIETLLQTDGHPTWSICGGHQQDDETAEEAAARELKEESGISTSVERLTDLKNHAIRNKPAKVFYAVVDAGTEAKPGSDVKQVKWVPVTALKDLNADDANLIKLAVKRVYDPDALVREAIEENIHRYPVAALAADIAPRGSQGILVVLEGEDIHRHAYALASHLSERGLPHCVVCGQLSLVAESALESAHKLRRLNPLTEAIIKAADALHRWESQVRPALEMGQFVVCEHWVDHDRKACLKRGLEPELFEALFRFLPKPDVALHVCGESTQEIVERFRSVSEADTDDPEQFFSDFVDKDLNVTFHISRSGYQSVYADEPFRFDWLVYSNDPEPPGGWKLPEGPSSHAHLGPDWKGETRTLEGYLREIDGQWRAFPKYMVRDLGPAMAERRFVNQLFATQEQAAYVMYRINRHLPTR